VKFASHSTALLASTEIIHCIEVEGGSHTNVPLSLKRVPNGIFNCINIDEEERSEVQ
jgi:hypothetical protein